MPFSSIILNGESLNLDQAKRKLDSSLPDWEREIFQFLVEWWNSTDFVSVSTSGSTGTPKVIQQKKELMTISAQMTGEYFNFKKSQKILLCLPVKFIAGKMMLVRALHWGLNVDYIEPKLQLEIPDEMYSFSAMTPPQVEASIDKVNAIQKLLLGGAPVSKPLETQLKTIPTHCYVSYGMTETVSHIAIRDLKSHAPNVYRGLPSVTFSTHQENQLIIHAPHLVPTPLKTTDCVQLLNANQFIWEGRSDFIINSGGLKISPEKLEDEISNLMDKDFFIYGKPNEKWGYIPILIIEGRPINTVILEAQLQDILSKNKCPKEIYFLDHFIKTENGKLNRKKTFEQVLFRP